MAPLSLSSSSIAKRWSLYCLVQSLFSFLCLLVIQTFFYIIWPCNPPYLAALYTSLSLPVAPWCPCLFWVKQWHSFLHLWCWTFGGWGLVLDSIHLSPELTGVHVTLRELETSCLHGSHNLNYWDFGIVTTKFILLAGTFSSESDKIHVEQFLTHLEMQSEPGEVFIWDLCCTNLSNFFFKISNILICFCLQMAGSTSHDFGMNEQTSLFLCSSLMHVSKEASSIHLSLFNFANCEFIWPILTISKVFCALWSIHSVVFPSSTMLLNFKLMGVNVMVFTVETEVQVVVVPH